MPRHCSAGGCKSRDNRDTRNAGITFHKLPKGAPRRNLWISNSHRADSWDPQTDFVYFCSKHFTPQSFELTGCSGVRRLKEDAYPTVFDLSSGVKGKRGIALQKQDDNTISGQLSSSGKQDKEQEHNQDPTVEEASTQGAESAHEDANQDAPCNLPPESRPHSPSRYMRRLPPPPGFYLSNEHSYAQHCPLLWRKRYDQVVGCLEKALQQLHAAKRRESRLRSTVLRLRDKWLKHTVLVSQEGFKEKVGLKRLGKQRGTRAPCEPEEGPTEAAPLGAGLFEDECSNQMEVDCHLHPKTGTWSKEDKRCCFYCGRGQVQILWQADCRGPETLRNVLPTHQVDSLQPQRSPEHSTCSIVMPERASGTLSESSLIDTTAPQVLVQSVDLQQWAVLPLSGTQKQGQAGGTGQDQQVQHQVLGAEDGRGNQFILFPVHSKKGLQSFPGTYLVTDESHVKRTTEDSGSLSGVDESVTQHSVRMSPSMEMKEDVREKLKEHLEGFHLQLSSEFKN